MTGKQYGPPEGAAPLLEGDECEPTPDERDRGTLPRLSAYRRSRPGCMCEWCLFPWWELSHCARCGDELPVSRREETPGRMLVCERCEEHVDPARRILTIGTVHWSVLPPEVRGALTGWLIWHGYGREVYERDIAWPIWRLEAVRVRGEQLGVWLEFGPAYLSREPITSNYRVIGRFGDKNIVARAPVLLPPPANPAHLEAAARALGCAW